MIIVIMVPTGDDIMKNKICDFGNEFFELKCLIMTLHNALTYCANELPECYYIDSLSKIIVEKTDKLSDAIDAIQSD